MAPALLAPIWRATDVAPDAYFPKVISKGALDVKADAKVDAFFPNVISDERQDTVVNTSKHNQGSEERPTVTDLIPR